MAGIDDTYYIILPSNYIQLHPITLPSGDLTMENPL